MTKEETKETITSMRIYDVTGMYHTYYLKDVDSYEYTPTILRIEFKDGSYVEYTRSNIVYIDVDDHEKELENEL